MVSFRVRNKDFERIAKRAYREKIKPSEWLRRIVLRALDNSNTVD